MSRSDPQTPSAPLLAYRAEVPLAERPRRRVVVGLWIAGVTMALAALVLGWGLFLGFIDERIVHYIRRGWVLVPVTGHRYHWGELWKVIPPVVVALACAGGYGYLARRVARGSRGAALAALSLVIAHTLVAALWVVTAGAWSLLQAAAAEQTLQRVVAVLTVLLAVAMLPSLIYLAVLLLDLLRSSPRRRV